VGSVSGGCIEKQLVEALRKGGESQSVAYRISDTEAKRYGLMCGGDIELVFETVTNTSKIPQLLAGLQAGDRMKRTLELSTGEIKLSTATDADQFSWDEQTLVQILGAHHRLIIIGAGELSRFTAQFASAADFEVQVCEPREEFRQAWPLLSYAPLDKMPDDAVKEFATHTNCAVLALTHDPNLDDLALMEAMHRLRAFDYTDQQLATIHAPIGISIGSRSSAEIAVSIVAQLIQFRRAA